MNFIVETSQEFFANLPLESKPNEVRLVNNGMREAHARNY